MRLNIFHLLFIFIGSCSICSFAFSQSAYLHPVKRDLNPEQGTLSGRVTESESGAALAGASVYIPDLKLGVIADSGGYYHFKGLPAGNYLVQVQYIGYKTITKNVFINGKTSEDFVLTSFALEESPVVITGLSKATQIKRSPVPVVAINHDYLAGNISTNIIDAIAKVPGVNALTTGPNVSKPFIRGLGFNRILTLYDGIRQEGQQWGDEHGIEVDQYGIDRIEVIKGPASLTYGSDALAGVVNLIPTQPAPEGKMTGEILAEYMGNNGEFGGSGMLGATKNGFEWMGRISHKEATNYRDKIDGRVYNTGFHETDANLALGLHRDWGYSHLDLSLVDDTQEIPDGSRDSVTRKFTKQITEDDLYRPIVSDAELASYKIPPIHQRVQHFRIYSSNNFTMGPGRLLVNVGFQNSRRREFSHPEMPDVPGLFLQLNTISYDLKYQIRDLDGWNPVFGINGMYQDNNVTRGTEFVIPSFKQFDIGPFAMVQKTFNKLDISGGLRFDSRDFNNKELYSKPDPVTGFDKAVSGTDTAGSDKLFSNYKQGFSGISGSAGATYNFTEKFSLKANIARGYRSPNISEISANGVHPGTNIYQIGNPDFKPEFSLQEDIGMEFTSKYAAISISLFNNSINNYIYNQRLIGSGGADSVLVPGNQTYKFQQGKGQLYGGEASIDIHPVKMLHFENSISVVYGRNKGLDPKLESDSNRYLPFMPPLHGISEIRYDFESKAHHIVHGFLKLQLSYYARQDRVYLADNTETPTKGYALVNAGVGAGFTNARGKTIFNLYIMGNNLFDVAYQDHLSRLKYFEFYPGDPRDHSGIYNMGRNIEFKVDFPLSFQLKK